jgi:cellulose synthase/poly-beta-1,6-N-acetylglucosamine synthase-like glycosyltransferase
MTGLVILSAGVILYTYVGYPALLRLLVWLRGPRPVQRAGITPRVSLVISAYNEASVIRRKLENSLALGYPRGALEIVVVSDASTDGTDEIVAEYAGRAVTLVRQAVRGGKTAGLNRTVPSLTGDIVVFSDANALYEPDAIQKLVRNFADPDVGCVTGESRYVAGGGSIADASERAYWVYETRLKRWESALGSMVGGDGAIYAIRRALWQRLPETAINDFLNPLQIVAAGWRAVYEPDAVCLERTAGTLGREFRRRLRIVSRSWRAVFQAPAALDPRRVGLFAWALVSHKILRWLTGVFALPAVVAGSLLVVETMSARPRPAGAALLLTAIVLTATSAGRRLVMLAIYAVAISAASIAGIISGSLGRVSGVWVTPRQDRVQLTEIERR